MKYKENKSEIRLYMTGMILHASIRSGRTQLLKCGTGGASTRPQGRAALNVPRKLRRGTGGFVIRAAADGAGAVSSPAAAAIISGDAKLKAGNAAAAEKLYTDALGAEYLIFLCFSCNNNG